MIHIVSLKLHAHWDALRAGRAAPGRDEIDLATVRDVLASVFLLDVAPGPADATFRLSGTRVDAVFGRPLRSTAFRRIWSGRSAAAGAGLSTGLTGGRPGVATARGGPPGRGTVEFELLLLPLEGGRQVLGSLAPLSMPGWMGLAGAAPLDVVPPGLVPLGGRHAAGPGCFGRRPSALTLHAGGLGGAAAAVARP